ncbi:GHKL domain-containing protein [Algoriphagus aestuariicola]|uniref:histidine kinase n=1 Tax=Algoriphagus aestuariicola TaxID=1852016 RepID=A0ABS3BQV1_9BACT|nr:7TM diverse intracellular signaling domain-containing protein [Algoriphagus aestuariicola]MBN7801663.1 GHKL domain-containing protein [Algoriphagus aestuariicola]
MKGSFKIQSLYWGLALLVTLVLISILIIRSDFFKIDYQVSEVKFYRHVDGQFEPISIPDDQVRSSFSLGFVADTVWAELDLSDFNGMGNPSIIEVRNPAFRTVELYKSVEGKGIENSTLLYDEHLGKSNPLTYPFPIFREVLRPGETYYLKIFSSEPVNFSVGIVTETDFYEKYTRTLLFVSVYMGIMLALFLYNLLLYFSVKDRVYLFYCLYILLISATQLSLLGYSYFFLFNENSRLFENSIVVFSSFSGIFGVLFLRNFLLTRKYVPLLNKALSLIVIVYSAGALARVSGMVELSYSFTDIGGLLVVLLFVTTAILIARKGYRPAFYFLAAWVFFLFGLLLFVFQNQGVIDLGSFANLPMLLGTAFEAIVLSLALADRINILKKEKEEEQAEKLKVLNENQILIREQNNLLEEKVRIRTEELEQTLRTLQNTQSQLVNQEKMASLGQLTAGIAHEINNPINFVSSNITPLKRDIKDIMEVIEFYRDSGEREFTDKTKKEAKQLEEDLELDYVLEEVEQLLKGMDDGAKRTVEIVKGLRIFSRVDEQDVKKVDLHDGINSTLILLNSSIPGKIRIVREFGELPMVECLAGKINQVFMNIINNAVHALTDHIDKIADPKIAIRTLAFSDHVVIEIEDNGPGMPETVKQRIFEPFFTTKPVGKGTGLGLSIVYSIIENHKGTLEVNTAEGQGTTFIISLPIYQNAPKYE